MSEGLDVPTLVRSAKAREAFGASFTCPDPTGVTAPCDGGEYDDQPVIPWGDQSQWRIVCPQFQSRDVFEKIQARRRAQERDEWIEAGRARGIPLRFTDATFETGALPILARFPTPDPRSQPHSPRQPRGPKRPQEVIADAGPSTS
jgi:hypothetical protein